MAGFVGCLRGVSRETQVAHVLVEARDGGHVRCCGAALSIERVQILCTCYYVSQYKCEPRQKMSAVGDGEAQRTAGVRCPGVLMDDANPCCFGRKHFAIPVATLALVPADVPEDETCSATDVAPRLAQRCKSSLRSATTQQSRLCCLRHACNHHRRLRPLHHTLHRSRPPFVAASTLGRPFCAKILRLTDPLRSLVIAGVGADCHRTPSHLVVPPPPSLLLLTPLTPDNSSDCGSTAILHPANNGLDAETVDVSSPEPQRSAERFACRLQGCR